MLESTADDKRPQPLPQILGLSPAELQRELAGDLDSIALKALRPEAEHRYASPVQLAEDLRRHRAGLPVEARQGTWRYRVGKFIRRHRVGVGLAAATLLVLTSLAIFMTWQAAQIAKERNAALAARDEAQTAQQAESRVVEFLTGLFENADPRQSKGQDITARELLESGVEKIRTELTDSPAVRARLLLTMADVYHSLSLFQESADLAGESAGLRASYGATAAEVAEAHLREAGSLISMGQYKRGAQLLAQVEEGLGADAPTSKRLSFLRGLLASSQGHYEEASGHYLDTIAVERRSESPDYAALAMSLGNLGFVQEQLGQPQAAEGYYLESLRIAREHLGDAAPLVASVLNNLGACLKDQGRVEEARDYYRQALELRTQVLGEDHLHTAQTRAKLAILDAEAGRWRQTVPALQATIASFEKHLGPEHPHVARAWNNLGHCFLTLGEYSDARSALDRGLEAITASVGAEHPAATENLLSQADLLIDTGDLQAARQLLGQIEPVLEASLGPGHRLFTALDKGRCRQAVMAAAPDAVAQCERADASNRETYGESHRSSLGTSAELSLALLAAGDVGAAAERLDAADRVADDTTSADHPDRLPLLLARAQLHRVAGDDAASNAALNRALEIADAASLSDSHVLVRAARRALTGGT